MGDWQITAINVKMASQISGSFKNCVANLGTNFSTLLKSILPSDSYRFKVEKINISGVITLTCMTSALFIDREATSFMTYGFSSYPKNTSLGVIWTCYFNTAGNDSILVAVNLDSNNSTTDQTTINCNGLQLIGTVYRRR